MVKKLQKLAERKAGAGSALGGVSALLESELAQTVRESAQQIWLAGLGAFTKAQGEGSKAFEALVKQGSAMQRKTQSVAEDKVGEMAGRMSSLAGDVGAKAGQHWDKLESIFEERVAKALNKLGVPSSKDVHALIERIDALSTTVAKLPGSGGGTGAGGRGAAKPPEAADGSAGKAAAKSKAARAKSSRVKAAKPVADKGMGQAAAGATAPATKPAPATKRAGTGRRAGKASAA